MSSESESLPKQFQINFSLFSQTSIENFTGLLNTKAIFCFRKKHLYSLSDVFTLLEKLIFNVVYFLLTYGCGHHKFEKQSFSLPANISERLYVPIFLRKIELVFRHFKQLAKTVEAELCRISGYPFQKQKNLSQLKLVTKFLKTISKIRSKDTSILLMRKNVKEENRKEVRT